MSEFEKRFPTPDFKSPCFTWHGQKDGWVATLEWILQMFDDNFNCENNPPINIELTIQLEMEDIIKEFNNE